MGSYFDIRWFEIRWFEIRWFEIRWVEIFGILRTIVNYPLPFHIFESIFFFFFFFLPYFFQSLFSFFLSLYFCYEWLLSFPEFSFILFVAQFIFIILLLP